MTTKIEHTVTFIDGKQIVFEHDSVEVASLWLIATQRMGFIELGSRIYPWHSVSVIHKKTRRY